MPKAAPKIRILLDLLKPQSKPEELSIRLMKWLLSTGRYIFIFVEAVVLLAFIARFKLDADLASKKEAIEEQIPYIESLRPFEILIRQTQLKLSTITAFNQNVADYPQILKRISDQIPTGVKILSLNLTKDVSKITIQINAQTQTNNDLNLFVAGMKADPTFSDVTLTSVGLDQGITRFTVNASAKILSQGGKSL